MIARHWTHRMARLWILAVALAATALPAAQATAGELDKLDTSLKLIPADAAFYSSMLRNREQFDAIRRSNAWAKIQAMPAVQMGLAMYDSQLGSPESGPAKLDAALKNPEVRKIVDLLIDMVSHEIFVYGDQSCADFVELLQEVSGAVQYGPMMLQATAQAGARDPNKLQAALAISALAEHADLIAMPGMVVGFKLENAALAKEQLIKLEAIGNILLESNERTKGRFKKTAVGDHEYLVLELDGGMIPWDEVPMDELQEMEAEEGDAQTVVDRLKELQLTIALGVRDQYLLCSIGPSLECLEKLGQDDRLIDRPELKPLEKFVDQRLTSIGYVGQEMNEQINNQGKNLDELLNLADKLLPLAELTDQQTERIRKDLEEAAEDLKGLMPEVGAMLSLNFLSDRGVESYQYAWGDHDGVDASKPLGLLQHVGGNPILGLVSRTKVSVEDYDLIAKWAKTAYGYFDELAMPKIPDPDAKKLRQFLDAALPLVERMDKANREMLIPALADGQSALVIDAKLRSKRLVDAMPETEEPMPMIEPAVVLGLSDAKLLKQAVGEYRAVVNGLIDAMRQVEGADVPAEIQIPEPQVSESSAGTIYSFPLPKDWGIDRQIVPNLGVSDEAAVLSISLAHTERLLKAAPLAVGGVLENTDRPLAMAGWLDWAGLVEAATPWVDFAIAQAVASKDIAEDQQKTVSEQVHTGLEVLKALRTITSESYLEDGVLVNHTLLEIRDVEK